MAAMGGLIALAAGMGIGRFVYTPILPFMEAAIGLSKAEGGLIASANFLGYLLGALAASSSLLRGGRRRWLLIALALSAATTGLMGYAATFETYLALRFAGGVASSFVLVFASALVLDRLAAFGRSGLSAIHFAGVGVGIAVSAMLTAGVAAAGLDWREQWQVAGAASLAGLALVFLLVPREAIAKATDDGVAGGLTPGLPTLIVAYGLFGFGYVITATFISTMVRGTPAIAELEAVIWLVVGLAAVPSIAFWTWVARALGNNPTFALACVVEGVGVAVAVLAPESALAVNLSAALLGGTFMGLTALGFAETRRITRGDPRRNLAFMTAAFGLGQMVGPTFGGLAYGIGDSFLVPSLVAAAALLLSALLVIRLRIVVPS